MIGTHTGVGEEEVNAQNDIAILFRFESQCPNPILVHCAGKLISVPIVEITELCLF